MDIGVFSATPNAAADPAVIAKRAEELGSLCKTIGVAK